jgi:rSAM/selenodomain-associated transferase 1
LNDNALIVVAKEPMSGSTKTRLCPPLSLERAAELYHCMLLDTVALMERVEGVDLTLAYAPDSAHAFFRELVGPRFRLVPQRGASLGERLSNALAEHFQMGYKRAVIMNSDGPTLPVACLAEAVSGLARADVTLGIGHDGGYYLIGMRQLHRGLFVGIEWSTERVIPQTLAACQSLGLSVHQLPEWYDIDVGADLERARRDLAKDPTAAPHTWRFLQTLEPTLVAQ